jgi:hypothetical protein
VPKLVASIKRGMQGMPVQSDFNRAIPNTARFTVTRSTATSFAIVDHDQGKSVTNDAEAVIADLTACFDL